ncbi:MAG: hypothetical protein V1887_03645 [Candidatus Aenigmatarchaeota archaeon]
MEATIPVSDSERKDLSKLIAELGVGTYMCKKETAKANREIGDNARADEFMEYAKRDAPLCVNGLVLHLSVGDKEGVIEGVAFSRMVEAVKRFGETEGLEMSEDELKAAVEEAKYEGLIIEDLRGFYRTKGAQAAKT